MSRLAVFGGEPVRKELFKAYNTIGKEEENAVVNVMRTGILSKYLGCWHDDFYGGEKVQTFEKLWAEKNESKFAVSVNSNTSGLITALGAIGIEPGDEVIVSPYSMSASAISPVFWGGIPVFADIDENTFCISPSSIEKNITARTKAILTVNIFGRPSELDKIMEIAKTHNLYVIEDCAQSPFTKYKEKYTGNWGHIGIFSLNYHKHIHTGEGGMITTNDPDLAERCQLIRNHGEAVAEEKGTVNINNIYGFNFRLPEIESAIGIEQLKKVDKLIKIRRENAHYLIDELSSLTYLDCFKKDKQIDHAYYMQPVKYLRDDLHRNKYIKAISAELPSSYMRENDPLISGGYVKPLYLQPVYQKRKIRFYDNTNETSYAKGICPVVEDMHYNKLITHEFIRPSMSKDDLKQVVEAFYKVDSHITELIERENEL